MANSLGCKRFLLGELWYESMADNYPAELSRMYTGLRTLANDGSVYGFFLQLKDLFEGMIRWYALTASPMQSILKRKSCLRFCVIPNGPCPSATG